MVATSKNNFKIEDIMLFFKDNQRWVYTIVTIVFLSILGFSIWSRYSVMKTAEQKASELDLVSSYDFSSILHNDRLKEEYGFWTTIADMITYGSSLKDEIKKAQDQRTKLSLPHDHFLHFLYVPPINIWKDPFSGDIDTTLIGEKYLSNNPYGDIELIQQWTNFFKDMWTDRYNTITDISLGAITPETWWYFSLPVTVQFETPDRRSFLLLLSKLSVTSYTDNISLINEFMYALRENIKKDKKEEIWQILSWWKLPSQVTTSDQLLGYSFYQWVKNGSGNIFVNQDIINKTIVQVAGCVNQTSQECLYMFREKYRSIPYIAYGVGKDNVDSVKWLQLFLQKLPPLINLDNFSFDKKNIKGRNKWDEWYKWSISLKVYGQDLSNKEVDEIADKLWWLCFANKTRLSTSYATSILTKLIDQLWKDYSINEKRAKQLRQMIGYIASIEWEYESLSNYKKVIRLFEIYRTIQEWSVCDVILNSNKKEDILSTITNPLEKDSIISSNPSLWLSEVEQIDRPQSAISVQEDFISPVDSGTWANTLSPFGNTTPIRRTVLDEQMPQ
jgi:hypothetical protein